MNTIWFIFIVAVQFACAVCSADGQNMSNLRTMEVDNKIFRGDDTVIELFPYQVLVTITYKDTRDQKKKQERCGGGIINQKVIITAGHCVHNKNPKKVKVRAGSSFPYRLGVLKDVEHIIVHESFVQEITTSGTGITNIDYDVALLKLKGDLKYTKFIKNIQLAEKGDHLAVGDFGIVVGWGYTNGVIEEATVLQKTKLPVMSKKKCMGKYTLTLNDRLFCAGFRKKRSSSTCKGDSGGPFVKNNKIYGIVSSALTDCQGNPSITFVTNTSAVVLHDWITANVQTLSSH